MTEGASASGSRRDAGSAPRTCESCARFLDDPQELERLFRGINALSSAWGSTRGRAGVCAVSGRFRDPSPACRDYAPRGEGEPT
jgi:hypothetical protein